VKKIEICLGSGRVG